MQPSFLPEAHTDFVWTLSTQAYAFRLYAICSCILALNLMLLSSYTAVARTLARRVVNGEDTRVIRGKVDVGETEHANVLRVQRAHRNAIENIPLFWIVGLLYTLTSPGDSGAAAYFITFVVARWLHTIFYLTRVQPWRTIMFAVGQFAIFGMGVQVLRALRVAI